MFQQLLTDVRVCLAALFRRRKIHGRVDEELKFHLAMREQQLLQSGLTPTDAHAQARRELGNPTLIAEQALDSWRFRWVDILAQDIRYALRTLRKSPGFTVAAVLCLALGIGANTAIFSLLDAVLLRSLPVPHPEQLVTLSTTSSSFSYPQFVYIRERVRDLEIFAHADLALNLSSGPVTDAVSGEVVSDNYFSALGVKAAVGRMLRPGDETVAVISHRFWQSRFGSDSGVVGRAVNLNGLAFTVVGVTQRQFFGVEVGTSPDVFVPLTMRDRLSPGQPSLPMQNRFWLDLMGRLKPRTSFDQARAQAELYYQQASADENLGPGANPRLGQFLRSKHVTIAQSDKGISRLRRQFRQPLQVLMIVVALVLLIACANVASLLLARGTARQKEIAIRLAIGASRARLLRQLLTESLALTTAGGLLGLLFASWSAASLVGFLNQTILDVSPDTRVLVFTAGVSVLTGVLFGVLPAFVSTKQGLMAGFRGEILARARRLDPRNLLVAGQVAISLLLVLGAGLFLRTLMNLRSLDAGFRGSNVLLVSFNPGLSRYSLDRTRTFYDQLLERVQGIPGVVSASIADQPLLAGAYFLGVSVEGQPAAPGKELPVALKVVTPRFFETMQIPVRLGRDFLPQDRRVSLPVAIVNESFVRQFFPGGNPIGKHIGIGPTPNREIVGVIADTKYRDLRAEVPNTVYLPMDQDEQPSFARTLHVRTAIGVGEMSAAIREQLQALDKDLPIRFSTFSTVVDAQLVRERLIAVLSGFFGVLAVILASLGLYGVVVHSVQRRTREIGIRMALGAQRGSVIRMVMRHSLGLIAAGLAIGLPLSLWISRLTANLLFGVTPGDPITIASAMLVLIGVAAAAGYLPARKASRVDPMAALRQE